jgi:hypothetical protein
MEYRNAGESAFFDPESASVKSLCFMSERATIAIGLSNGAVYFISMKTGRR